MPCAMLGSLRPPTAADGRYTLTYDPAVVTDAATARLIAPVRAGDPSAGQHGD